MAQQTQISRVDAAWTEFMARFPSVRSVAEASVADVLRAWAGLGYNRRAMSLRRAAIEVVDRFDGSVPADVELLESLPGIGPYTARAVAAVAFGQPVAAVDTNVRRVISRLAGDSTTALEVQARADELLDRSDPAAWTHATMDLGATVCRARSADCDACPLATWCASAGQPIGPPQSSRASAPEPFEATTRWLRGRIVAELRTAADGSWTELSASIGEHDPAAVQAAIDALASEGLVERASDGSVRLPS